MIQRPQVSSLLLWFMFLVNINFVGRNKLISLSQRREVSQGESLNPLWLAPMEGHLRLYHEVTCLMCWDILSRICKGSFFFI
jgi:hypothetical protein